jgi:hypothetical protein
MGNFFWIFKIRYGKRGYFALSFGVEVVIDAVAFVTVEFAAADEFL